VSHAITATLDTHLVLCLLKHFIWAKKLASAGPPWHHKHIPRVSCCFSQMLLRLYRSCKNSVIKSNGAVRWRSTLPTSRGCWPQVAVTEHCRHCCHFNLLICKKATAAKPRARTTLKPYLLSSPDCVHLLLIFPC